MKYFLKKLLLTLLEDDYDVQMAVTKVANPELADEIERPLYPNRPRFSERHGWWNGDLSKPPYISRNENL